MLKKRGILASVLFTVLGVDPIAPSERQENVGNSLTTSQPFFNCLLILNIPIFDVVIVMSMCF